MNKYYMIHLLDEGCLAPNMTIDYIKKHCCDLVGATEHKRKIKKMIRDYEEEFLDGCGYYAIFEYQDDKMINVEIM